MKIRLLLTVTVCVFLQLAASADTYPKLQELVNKKRYFELRDALKVHKNSQDVELLYYRGADANKFNQPEQSIQYLEQYLKAAGATGGFARVRECYELLSDDYTKTYEYRKAAEANNVILTKYRSGLDAHDTADYENIYKIRQALSDVPRQTISFQGDSRIKIVRDRIGLMNIPVETQDQQLTLGFDTGAGFSVATESYAGKLGLKLIDTQVDISSITGDKVKARLGVAPRLKIGNVTLQNVVFIVFADKDMYIAPIHFQINGLIGFPVIAALQEISFDRGGDATIPERPGSGGEQNLCLDGLAPLIEGTYKGRRLTFCFDTGANTSYLYPPFFKEFEEEIKAQAVAHSEKIQGAGGSKVIKTYVPKDLALTFAGKEAQLRKPTILTEYTLESSHYFYGNIGRDLTDQFKSTTINFKSMSIDFQ